MANIPGRKICSIISILLILALLVSACSIDLSQSSVTVPTQGFVTATLPPLPQNGNSQQSGDATPALPTINIPVTWASLNLSGRLVYTTAQQQSNTPSMDIRVLDLATGQIKIIFQALNGAWIYFASVSPDGKQLVMAYAQPPGADGSAHQELYLLPLDGSQPPQLLLVPPTNDDEYFQPDWSSDGKYIYFSHVNYQAPPKKGQHYPLYELYRMAYPGGQPEKLVEQAFWPRISDDGSRLAYVSLDPMTGKNRLFLANADGTNPVELTLSGQDAPDIVDAPLFSPDGQSLYFSAPVPAQSYQPEIQPWWEKLLGITVASAHTVPSDWWSVPLTGGVPTQITHLGAIGLFGSLSPGKKYIASYSGGGLFVMNPDGTNINMLVSDLGGVPGTVSWMP